MALVPESHRMQPNQESLSRFSAARPVNPVGLRPEFLSDTGDSGNGSGIFLEADVDEAYNEFIEFVDHGIFPPNYANSGKGISNLRRIWSKIF